MRTVTEPHIDAARLEARTQALGRELFAAASREHAHLSVLNRWTAQVLSWCLADDAVKSAVLRFIDVLPSLQTSREVARHVREYFPAKFRMPAALRLGAGLARSGLLTQGALAAMIRQGVERVAQQFIARHHPEEAASVIRGLAARGTTCSLDLLGEQVVSRAEADRYAERCGQLIELSARVAEALPPGTPGAVCGPRVHLSVKPSALSPRFDPISPEASVRDAAGRLAQILAAARRHGGHVTLDMEQAELRDLTLELARHALAQGGAPPGGLGVVLQAYLRDSEAVAGELLRWLAERDVSLTVRLVKGAYWDSEVALAAAAHWPVPVYERKAETDQAFERLTRRLLGAAPRITTAVASHNVRSIAHAMAAAELLGLRKDQLEFQLLYGMGDALQAAIVSLGYPVRVYTPIGELIPGMAYLVRRILENTANESFLRQDMFQHRGADELLRPPRVEGVPPASLAPGWRAEPLADFSKQPVRQAMAHALTAARGQAAERYPLWLAGDRVNREAVPSRNPARPDEVLGWVSSAQPADVDAAVAAAQRAQARWADTPAAQRAACLRRAAAIIREHRAELAAWEVLEEGKPWREADADVVETIEYVEYYSAQMERLAGGVRLDQAPGERNLYRYEPRGVAAVIAPWNFPAAILSGMAGAALVAGNPVILKPAEQSSVVALRLMALLQQAGWPPGVLQCLPGSGETIGAALVRHPGVHTILFTGSKAVGLSIIQACGAPAPGQRHLKHVIAEMGGKNAVIVDADADLDAAVLGLLRSAFGYSGQKCSAASRLIALESVADRLLPRLAAATDRLVVGDPADPDADIGPLIEAGAQARLREAIARAARVGRMVYQYPESRLPRQGYFVGPAIAADVPRDDALAREELFGPLLAVFRVKTFDEALALANDTDYALTGGVYSRTPAHLEQAAREFDVGNLYINRPITGAMVGRQPFGGRRLSGLGTKAGGPDYLRQLLVPKTICINTARYGIPLE